MSIKLERAEQYRRCNSCGLENKVVKITAMMILPDRKQGTQLALCEGCVQKLTLLLNERYTGVEG